MAFKSVVGGTPRKKKNFKVGKVSVHIETTSTLLNPNEAWKPYKLENYTGTWTGTPISHVLDMAVADFKHIEPRLSERDNRWARFAQKAGGKTLVIFKAEKEVRGNCVIAAKPHNIYLYFSTGDSISITVEHERGFKASESASLTGDPKIAIRSLIDKIAAVMESGVEFPSED